MTDSTHFLKQPAPSSLSTSRWSLSNATPKELESFPDNIGIEQGHVADSTSNVRRRIQGDITIYHGNTSIHGGQITGWADGSVNSSDGSFQMHHFNAEAASPQCRMMFEDNADRSGGTRDSEDGGQAVVCGGPQYTDLA